MTTKEGMVLDKNGYCKTLTLRVKGEINDGIRLKDTLETFNCYDISIDVLKPKMKIVIKYKTTIFGNKNIKKIYFG